MLAPARRPVGASPWRVCCSVAYARLYWVTGQCVGHAAHLVESARVDSNQALPRLRVEGGAAVEGVDADGGEAGLVGRPAGSMI